MNDLNKFLMMSAIMWEPMFNSVYKTDYSDLKKPSCKKVMRSQFLHSTWRTEHIPKSERKGKTPEEIAELRKRAYYARTGINPETED